MGPTEPVPDIRGRLYHFGVVVRNVDDAMQQYTTLLGVPRFWRKDTHYQARHRGWEGTIGNRNAFGKWGELIVELVEPGLGDGPAHEFLRNRGEGVFHVGYATDDPGQRPGGVEACFQVLGTELVYLDTIERLGFFIELVPLAAAERIMAQTAALDS